MAANDYYNSHSNPYGGNSYGYDEPHHYNEPIPPPAPPSSTKPPQISTDVSPISTTSKYYGRQNYSGGHQTLGSTDNGYYMGGAGAASHENDQYADNIPLKSKYQKQQGSDEFLGQNTQYQNAQYQNSQYPPSPEAQRPLPLQDRPRGRKGWFSGKIPWVVYVVTVVQIAVFIAEIVKNGTLVSTLEVVCC